MLCNQVELLFGGNIGIADLYRDAQAVNGILCVGMPVASETDTNGCNLFRGKTPFVVDFVLFIVAFINLKSNPNRKKPVVYRFFLFAGNQEMNIMDFLFCS